MSVDSVDSRDAHDTRPDGRERQLEAWRRLDPARRLEIALELSEAMVELTLDGLQARHPDEPRSRLRALHRPDGPTFPTSGR